MFGDEQRVPVRFGELRAGVKCQAQRRRMSLDHDLRRYVIRRVVPRAELRIEDIFAMNVGIAVVGAGSGRAVYLFGRQIIPQPVPAVVGKPEFTGLRVPVQTDGIAHTGCI